MFTPSLLSKTGDEMPCHHKTRANMSGRKRRTRPNVMYGGTLYGRSFTKGADPVKNTKNTGKNGEKTQGETLKNKSNHTSTRPTNTQDPQGR